jgi:hypothetical protein
MVWQSGDPLQGPDMSLNQSEQMVFEYVQGHAEERQHWQEKVRQIVRVARDPHVAASSVEAELWRYYRERAGVVREFKQAVAQDGSKRVSLRSLAEYWIRVWCVPKPRSRPPQPGAGEGVML